MQISAAVLKNALNQGRMAADVETRLTRIPLVHDFILKGYFVNLVASAKLRKSGNVLSK